MRSLIALVFILAFMACNNQPSQKATTNIQKSSDYGFGNLKGKPKSIESKTVNFDSAGKLKGDSIQSVGVYDKDGNIVKETNTNNSGITTTNEISYYSNGFMKEEKATFNGVVQFRLTIDSVVTGQPVGAKVWDANDKQIAYCEAINNEYGQLIGGKTFNMNGTLQFAFESKLDGLRFIGGSKTDSTGKMVLQHAQILNAKNDPAEERYTSVKEGVTTTTKLTHKYDSYDEKDNWTQQSTYINDKLVSITKRAITYYMD
jgi:hypothetical protein